MPLIVNAAAITTLPASNRKRLHIVNDGPDAVAWSQNTTDTLATIKADRATIPATGAIILDVFTGDVCTPLFLACPAGTASVRYTETK